MIISIPYNKEEILLTSARDQNGYFHIVSLEQHNFNYNEINYITTFERLNNIIRKDWSDKNFMKQFFENTNAIVDYNDMINGTLNVYFINKEQADEAIQWVESYIVANKLQE
jgi:hypothetical protein